MEKNQQLNYITYNNPHFSNHKLFFTGDSEGERERKVYKLQFGEIQ